MPVTLIGSTIHHEKNYLLFLFIIFTIASGAQTTIHRDPQIEKMVSEASKDPLEMYIRKLVGLGTRNTPSTQTNPKRGIGTARTWVLNRFTEFAKQSNGRLTALIDTVVSKLLITNS